MRSRVGGTPIPPATDGRRHGHGRGWHRESDRTTATDAGNQTNSKAVWTGPLGPTDAAKRPRIGRERVPTRPRVLHAR